MKPFHTLRRRLLLTGLLSLVLTVGAFAFLVAISPRLATLVFGAAAAWQTMATMERLARYLLSTQRSMRWMDLHYRVAANGGDDERLFRDSFNAMANFIERRKRYEACVLTRVQGYCLEECDADEWNRAIAKFGGPNGPEAP